MRIIDRVDFRAHSDPLFFNHNTLKVNDIYALQLGIFMHQLLAHDLLRKSHCGWKLSPYVKLIKRYRARGVRYEEWY